MPATRGHRPHPQPGMRRESGLPFPQQRSPRFAIPLGWCTGNPGFVAVAADCLIHGCAGAALISNCVCLRLQGLAPCLLFRPDCLQQRRRQLRVLPVSPRSTRHVGHGAAKGFQAQIRYPSTRGHLAYAHPTVRRNDGLPFSNELCPCRVVAKFRRFDRPDAMAGSAGFLVQGFPRQRRFRQRCQRQSDAQAGHTQSKKMARHARQHRQQLPMAENRADIVGQAPD